jgi:transketolase
MTTLRAAVLDRVDPQQMSPLALHAYGTFDAAYRTLCAMLYNYAPMSGHPGGSISSGRIVASLTFGSMDYDIADPDREDADVLSYAAGHKALGLYALSALRNEIVRLSSHELLPADSRQVRFEDLLGFRKNPNNDTPLFRLFGSKPLDGHPTPATPFVKLATGASGVGIASSFGLALAMTDWFGSSAPRVHVLEGEGGLTPGRVAEALAFAGTASLHNVIVHVDWNQSSIDSDRVTREGDRPGDYVQWDPAELFALHDWNVISVDDGTDFRKIAAAQQAALAISNGQPTAIVYRTQKGWQYGIEGRASHGAGHKLCSPAFFGALDVPLEDMPTCGTDTLVGAGTDRSVCATPCANGSNGVILERCYWQALTALRRWLALQDRAVDFLAQQIVSARDRLNLAARSPRRFAPIVDDVYALASKSKLPRELELAPGSQTSLRSQLGKVLGYLNRFSGGSLFVAAADLLSSTSVSEAATEFAGGYFHSTGNSDSRTLSVGGICEDAMCGVLSGISSFGHHIGVGSSYAAFLAPLGHISARLHAIGNQARHEKTGLPSRPMILVCGHAGLKTGEDGPTHADPQPLQMLQENFPSGALITLTPWDPQEIWPLINAALSLRPAVIAPFVSRPVETIVDRDALDLAPASDSVKGVYRLHKSRGVSRGGIVLQESGVTYAFVTEALPLLMREGIDVNVYYVASAELFDTLAATEREAIFPESVAREAMGITGFTLPTMYRWIRSDFGRSMTMHPFMNGRYPGSGSGRAVIAEAGLDGASQAARVREYVRQLR